VSGILVKTEEEWLKIRDKFKEQFDNHTSQNGDCILWTKTKPYTMGIGKPKLYLTTLIDRKLIDIRKAAHWLVKGFSKERSVFISCGVPNCVNLNHIYLTNNHLIHNRKNKCKKGHDLTDEKNLLYAKRYLKNGEQYYRPRCRICDGENKRGAGPKTDNRKIKWDTIETFDKDKCVFGHDLVSKTYTSGVTKRICPKCKAASTRRRRLEEKGERNATTNNEN